MFDWFGFQLAAFSLGFGPLPAFYDENSFVVDSILFADLLKVPILFNRMLQDGVTDFFRRLIFVSADYLFELTSVL